MNRKLIFMVMAILGTSSSFYGQIIFGNKINDVNPNLSNPYSNGQTFDSNITVSGIGRGSGLNGNVANDRYNARDWNLVSFDPNDYFEFIITPKAGYEIDFVNFTYRAQVSNTGPRSFALRSSVDGFISNIFSPSIPNSGSEVAPEPIVLSDSSLQNCTVPIVFRLYGWGGADANGTLSINEFAFNGVVSCATLAPIPTAIVQPNCFVSKGSIALHNLPAESTWDLYQNDVLTVSGGIGSSTVITGLIEGSYSYKVYDGKCKSVASADVLISRLSTAWNGTTWSNGVPTPKFNIVFNGAYSSGSDLAGCSCQVNFGEVVFNAGNTLTLTNGVAVIGGLLVFENKSSLIQINDQAVNMGNIAYKRETTPIDKFDYTYWSSPVMGQTLLAVSPNTLSDKFFSFNAAVDDWQQENPSNIMEVGKGYIIRGPQNYTVQTAFSTYEASFVGVPNNGELSSAIGIAGSSNLVGNPYPSALDADSFLIFNKELIDGTLSFWTHNTDIALNAPNPGSGIYAYSSDDYASYNLTGGVGTQAQSYSGYGAVSGNVPSGKIASGQAFFTTSIAAGNIIFKNSMRVGVDGITGDNSQFFKFKKSQKRNNIVEKNRVWLNLSNSQGAFKQTLVGYITAATDDYDRMFDGESFDGSNYIDFYSICDDKKLVIQGRALPFDKSDTVQLGYRANFAGSLAINIDQVDGRLENKNIFIEDKEQHIIHNLTNRPYDFITERGTFNDRFVLRYTDKGVTKFEATLASHVLVLNKDKQLSISSFAGPIDKAIIFDKRGRKIYQKTNVDSEELKILDLVSSQQVLFLTVVLKDGKSITKKIVY